MKDFAVKHGRTFTTFQTSAAAIRYAEAVLGSVVKYRNNQGKWVNLF